MTKLQQRKAEKLVILVRYFLKQAYTATDGTVYKKGSVICLVRNPEGREYYVTLNRNNRHSCQCEGYATWNKRCYHIEHCREVENARLAEAREAQRNQIATREQALAATRAASETDLARIEAETLAQIEQEQATPVAPKSEQARIADLDNEFPIGMSVPTFHGADVLVENGIVVESVATNFEGIDYVVVEALEKGERAGISCKDLRCLIRESIDEEAKVARWTEQEMLKAPLNGSRAFSLLR